MKKRLLGPLLAMALMGLAPATAAAAEVNMGSRTVQAECTTGNSSSRGGAAALAALVAVAAAVPADVDLVVCNILNNSLNNLLQNADIHVLENILNNSPILSGITISDITVNALTGVTTITILGGPVLVLQ